MGAIRVCTLRLRHPGDNTGDGMLPPPGLEFGIIFHTIAENGLIIFDAHDLFRFGRFIFQLQDRMSCFIGEGRNNTIGHLFEIAVVSRTLQNVDHIDLPHLV